MKLNLKYTAAKVDEIEQAKNMPIENCITDTSISSLTLFIQKGLIDDNGQHGVSKAVAMSTLENYFEKYDKDELVFDIMEALINGGFLSRKVDLESLRKASEKKIQLMTEKIENL